jgi:hypothetical protein
MAIAERCVAKAKEQIPNGSFKDQEALSFEMLNREIDAIDVNHPLRQWIRQEQHRNLEKYNEVSNKP